MNGGEKHVRRCNLKGSPRGGGGGGGIFASTHMSRPLHYSEEKQEAIHSLDLLDKSALPCIKTVTTTVLMANIHYTVLNCNHKGYCDCVNIPVY